MSSMILPGIAAFLLIAVIFGFLRGASRSKFRMILVILSAVIAYVATLVLKTTLSLDETVRKLNEVLIENGLGDVAQLAQYSEALEKIILQTGTAIVAPIVFFVLFFALYTVTWALYFIITLLLFPLFHASNKKKSFRKTRSLFHGLVQGVVTVIAVMIPLTCYLEMAPIVLDRVDSDSEIAQSIPEFETVKGEIIKLNNDTVVSTFRNFGGGWLYENLTSFAIGEGEDKIEVRLITEIDSLFDLATNVMGLAGKDIASFTEAEAQTILKIGSSFGDSKLLTSIASEIIHAATGEWKEGNAFLGVTKPTLGETFDPMLDKMVLIFYESSEKPQYLGEDMASLSSLVAVFVRSEVLANASDINVLAQKLSQDEVIPQISTILGSNPRLIRLMPDITNLSVKILATTLGIPSDNTTVYNDMMKTIADEIVASKGQDASVRIESLKAVLNTEFDKAGMDVTDAYIDLVSAALVADFGDFDGIVTPEFIAEFFVIYNESYNSGTGSVEVSASGSYGYIPLAGQNGGNSLTFTYPKYTSSWASSAASSIGKYSSAVNEVASSSASEVEKLTQLDQLREEHLEQFKETLAGASENSEKIAEIFDGISTAVKTLDAALAEGSEKLSSLNSSENAKFECTTAQSLMGKITDDELDQAEAEKQGAVLNAMLGCAAEILGNTEKPENLVGSLTTGVGTLLDSLADTKLFGKDGTAEIFGAILESPVASEALGFSKEEIDNIKNDFKENEECNYSSLMNGVSSIVDIVLSLKDGEITTDKIEGIIVALDGGNAKVIGALVTVDRLRDIGIPTDKIDEASHLLKMLLTNLGEVTGEENVDKEAVAVKYLLDLAFASKDSSNTHTIFGDTGIFKISADEFLTHVLDSKAISSTGVDAYNEGLFNPFSVKINSACTEELTEAVNAKIASTSDENAIKALRGISALLGLNVQ